MYDFVFGVTLIQCDLNQNDASVVSLVVMKVVIVLIVDDLELLFLLNWLQSLPVNYRFILKVKYILIEKHIHLQQLNKLRFLLYQLIISIFDLNVLGD